MNNQDLENRLIEIEMVIANHEKVIEELNQVIIEQGEQILRLQKQSRWLIENIDIETVKPLSEETPPPHY